MLKKIHSKENPIFTIITPLLPNDTISEETYNSVIFGTLNSFNWYSYSSENNVAKNFELGFNEVDKLGEMGQYVIKIDNDTIWEKETLDELVASLNFTEKYIVYSYCGFEYKGYINAKFPKKKYDQLALRKSNYISSNSMFKSSIIRKIPLVTDNKYKRLLDYAYLLKLLKFGYHGKESNGYFVAKSGKSSISSGSHEDYFLKLKRVHEDFL